jgi:hypothetical protein
MFTHRRCQSAGSRSGTYVARRIWRGRVMTLEPNVYGACSTGPPRMAAGLKTAMGLHPSRVRIPCPPLEVENRLIGKGDSRFHFGSRVRAVSLWAGGVGNRFYDGCGAVSRSTWAVRTVDVRPFMLAWPESVRTPRSGSSAKWHATGTTLPTRLHLVRGLASRIAHCAPIGEPASCACQRSQTASMAPLACHHPSGQVHIRGGHPAHVQHGDDRVGDLGLLDHATQGGA